MTNPDRPNILLITTDQQQWKAQGSVNLLVRTPALDRLAAEGTRFDRAYCPNPTCTPSRASIITGKYPSQHGAWALGTKLDEGQPTVGRMLAERGYRTSLIGKAHFQQNQSTPEHPSIESMPHLFDFDWWNQFSGPFYGFDHVELLRHHAYQRQAGAHYGLWLEKKEAGASKAYFRGGESFDETAAEDHIWTIPEEYHYNTWIVERTHARLAAAAESDRPFFLWASFPDPHAPLGAPECWIRQYDPDRMPVPSVAEDEHERNPPHFALTRERDPDFSAWSESGQGMHGMSSHLLSESEIRRRISAYYAMTSYTDEAVGRILETLDSLGLADQTLVVFTSDHGDFMGEHGLRTKGPFHYEELVRVPFIVRYPGVVPAGKTSDTLQSLVDLAPTFLAAGDCDLPLDMSGRNQWDVWTGRRSAVRDHVLIENRHEPTTICLKTYVDEDTKITTYFNRDYGELYDLKNDPGETHNRWQDPDYAALKANLLLRLVHAQTSIEPLPMPRVSVA